MAPSPLVELLPLNFLTLNIKRNLFSSIFWRDDIKKTFWTFNRLHCKEDPNGSGGCISINKQPAKFNKFSSIKNIS